MFYELSLKRNTVSESGLEKEVSEKYIIEGAELFCEAEAKALEYLNGGCNVTAIKQSKIREFINNKTLMMKYIFLVLRMCILMKRLERRKS